MFMLWHAAPALVVDWVWGGVGCWLFVCLSQDHKYVVKAEVLKSWTLDEAELIFVQKLRESRRNEMRGRVKHTTPLPLPASPEGPALSSTACRIYSYAKKTDLESRSLSIKILLQFHLWRFSSMSVALPVSCLCLHGSFSVPSAMRVTRWAGRPGAEQTPFVLCFR